MPELTPERLAELEKAEQTVKATANELGVGRKLARAWEYLQSSAPPEIAERFRKAAFGDLTSPFPTAKATTATEVVDDPLEQIKAEAKAEVAKVRQEFEARFADLAGTQSKTRAQTAWEKVKADLGPAYDKHKAAVEAEFNITEGIDLDPKLIASLFAKHQLVEAQASLAKADARRSAGAWSLPPRGMGAVPKDALAGVQSLGDLFSKHLPTVMAAHPQ